jgi:hypothetical protein
LALLLFEQKSFGGYYYLEFLFDPLEVVVVTIADELGFILVWSVEGTAEPAVQH